jgi:hypothetical protein
MGGPAYRRITVSWLPSHAHQRRISLFRNCRKYGIQVDREFIEVQPCRLGLSARKDKYIGLYGGYFTSRNDR